MKKVLFIFFIFIFASSASATVQAPSGTISVGTQSGETATQPPPIAQVLIREGDFAIQLAEALKMGQAKNEPEAQSALASAGIAPKNGWIADYPMTPDIVGELQNAVGKAADSGKLGMKKVEALKAFRTTLVELQLPIIAQLPERYAESPSPATPQYAEPSVIENYYDIEGPPVVTYYPPPWDYYYLYAWVPSPFWCSDFFFPGFFVLHDFHRVVFVHQHPHVVTNHITDPRTGSISAIDPARRRDGSILGGKETPRRAAFNSTEARMGARSIFENSRNRVALSHPSAPATGRGLNARNMRGGNHPGSSGPGNRGFSASHPRSNHGSNFGRGGSRF
ncbi:MAG: hypothetical protein ABSG44_09720 [Thermodesulfobacteriota bacterium]|jgi:hypothetical protein